MHSIGLTVGSALNAGLPLNVPQRAIRSINLLPSLEEPS